MSCAGLTLMMVGYEYPLGEDLQGIPEHHVICAAQVNAKRTDFLLSNKPALARELYGISARPLSDRKLKKPKWPPLSDRDEIPPDAAVDIVPIDANTAVYFRELWAHAMLPSTALQSFLLTVDGRAGMVMAIGFTPPSSCWEGKGYLHWAISPPSRRRIQRLALACALTGAFRDLAFKDLPAKTQLQSTCFSRHPQVNSYRGLFEQIEREVLPDGRYRLVYTAPFGDATWAQCFTAWHEKEAKRLGNDTL
jgi:hypothetical protein